VANNHQSYLSAINRAIDAIVVDLRSNSALGDLASVAGFSPFHFHRIFRALTGETPTEFRARVRLEQALFRMAYDRSASLTDIAIDCGFGSGSSFSRAFKTRYGVPPSKFDIDRFRADRRQEMSDNHHLVSLPDVEDLPALDVKLRSLPARSVAYLRVTRPYEDDRVLRAARKLERWAEERNLADGQWLGYSWDVPEIVPLDKCRYDVGLELPATPPGGMPADPAVSQLRLPKMTVAEVEVSGSIELETEALVWLYRAWLPASGFAPADLPGFEAWVGRPFTHGPDHFELRVQLPIVKPRG